MQSPTGPKVYPKVPKHVRVWGGPVEPAAVVVKVEAPLNGRACGWACLGSYDPALAPEAPIGLIKKDSTMCASCRVSKGYRGMTRQDGSEGMCCWYPSLTQH